MLHFRCYNRTVVSELKEEVRNLRAHELASGKSLSFPSFHTQNMMRPFNYILIFDLGASPLPLSPSRAVRAEEADSDSEDLSPTPSLAEISSDDLSWLDDGDAGEQESFLHTRTFAFSTYTDVAES